MASPDLAPDQQAQAEHLADLMTQASREEVRALARLLVSKSDREILGVIKFQVRDLVHRLGAKAIEASLAGRQKIA